MFCMQHFSLVLLLLKILKLKSIQTKSIVISMMHLSPESLTDTSYCTLYSKLCADVDSALCHMHCWQLCFTLPSISLLQVSTSVTLTSDCINRNWSILLLCTMGPCSKVMIHETKHLNGPCQNLYTLGTITSHHPTSHLEVWLYVLPLPTWLKIYPYWRSLLESMYPLSLLSASLILAAP